jgi:glyoxylase-like metal-dependent hydrolase (beta-lactamase superfamily II)
MIFKPYYAWETGCASYLLGCGGLGRCAVVDPHERFIDAYIGFAASKEMRITHVLETHVHADHRSGGRAMAERVGAVYGLHRKAEVAAPFEPLDDGQEIELGNTRVRVLSTPGHTPDSVCFLISDLRRGPAPWMVLTGDTLFVGAVGRADLPGREEDDAGALFDSLHRKLMSLPDEVEIYPAHFAGSACGAGMSGKPSSTVGFERRWNPMLALDRPAFIASLGASPPKPAAMAAMLAHNRGWSSDSCSDHATTSDRGPEAP